ncbi:MAG TPA: tetratricopeptide repeat protein, partial [Terracidiphilus sp.]
LTGDTAQEYFSDGLTEEMISQMGSLDPQHLGVIARTSVMHYKNSQTPLTQIGHELGVQYVLEGSVRRDAGRVRIAAQLIQVSDQSHLWAHQYDRQLTDLLAVQTEISAAIANEIKATLPGQGSSAVPKRAAAYAATTSYEAYDLYLQGRYFWNKRTVEGFRQAALYFQRAIDKDSNYARAYAGLADTYGLMSTWLVVPQNEFMPKARAAAERAIEIDEGLAEAHASLALIAENYDYDWGRAEREFRRAIDLNPQYATAHQWYAEFLAWQARFEEAFAESEQARQIDPMSLIIARDHAGILYYSRQYDRAIAECRAVLDMDPNFEPARIFIARSYEAEGKFAEALDEIDLWRGEPQWAERTYVYSRWGRTEEARQSLAKFEESTPPTSASRTAASLLAYMGIEGHDQVIGRLERAYSEHSNAVVMLKVEPLYDPLRGDPRFKELLHRLALGP